MSVRTRTPNQVVTALLANGWQIVGERAGAYTRLARRGETQTRHMLLIPLDESAPEFDEMLSAALGQLEQLMFDGAAARNALHLLYPEEFG